MGTSSRDGERAHRRVLTLQQRDQLAQWSIGAFFIGLIVLGIYIYKQSQPLMCGDDVMPNSETAVCIVNGTSKTYTEVRNDARLMDVILLAFGIGCLAVSGVARLALLTTGTKRDRR